MIHQSSPAMLFERGHELVSFRWVAAAVLLIEAGILYTIIQNVSYTEIDWAAYMAQIEQIVHGQRDYAKIRGDTGPLVYPAGHVYLYSLLYYFTDRGQDIRFAQYVFAGFYLLTQAFTMATYARARAPWWVLPFLACSKRLHSIYVLRLFNDGPCSMFVAMALFFVTRRQLSRATAAYSLALSIKMGALLYLPGLVLLLLMNCGPRGTVKHLAVILELQMLLAGPFLLRHPRTYLQGAFDFGRQFLWTWTVNWRFLSPDIFQDRRFQSTLLVLHGTTLFIFAWSRWSRPARRGLASVAALCLRSIVTWPKDVLQGQSPGEKLIPNDARLLADYALTTMLSSNLIGILFARSLHYQFYSWFAWGMPYLCFIATLDSDGMATISNVPERGRQSRITKMMLLQHWLSVVALAAPRVIPLCILEACWLTFPSTRASSGLHCMVCAIILIWVWASSATRPTLVLEPTRSRLNTDLRLATRKRPRK